MSSFILVESDASKAGGDSHTPPRTSSRCSGRFEVEERVVPGAISRPRTPELNE